MEYIFLSAISSVSIFVLFKFIHLQKLPNLQPIVINYTVASLLGFSITSDKHAFYKISDAPWFPVSLILGVLFILMFFTIAVSSQKAGISATTVASKMSVVIPILFSIIYYRERVDTIKVISVVLAVIAVIAAVYKKGTVERKGYLLIILPFLLFIGLGLLDVLVKYAQHELVIAEQVPVFSAFLFMVALTASILYGFSQKKFIQGFNLKVLIAGILLGIANFYSIYFIILALNKSGIDSSYVFGINNMIIVVTAVIIGRFAFKEKLSILNWSGILMSLLAIYLMIR
ncbi:MAG: hypothetical protein CVU05_15345 [Bacteroidetes bacterium HGW-Bacteroidetes-21]|nr:MAG: hypothetical protein CVU05_15345 [Bacteroidetes bacterium HGW-Bacteroidetes-21]